MVWFAAVSELAGALGPMVKAPRAYDGPMGKSDRAFVFGALGLAVGLGLNLPAWLVALPIVLCVLMALNCVKRIRAGVVFATGP